MKGPELAHDHVPPDIAALTGGSGFMLWQVANGWQRTARAALGPIGLTYVQAVLLAGLAERLASGAKVSQAALAQSLGADVMMTSQVLRTLEAAGFIRRDRDPGDTRARTLALTDAGETKLNEAMPVLAEIDATFFETLGRKEERFVKSLRKLWRKRCAIDAEGSAPKPADASDGKSRSRKSGQKGALPAVKAP
jgi:DNA-binding MarR family transcriptional regulator